MNPRFIFGEDYENRMHAIGDWLLAYPTVEKLLGDILGKTILDYGCGTGKFTRRLRNLGANVIAVDRENSSIESAKKRGKSIDYRVIENENLSFLEPESIDHAVSTFAFCMMREDEVMQRVTNQISEKLRSKGYFIVLDPHPDGLGYDFVSVKREKPIQVNSGMPIRVQLTGLDTKFHDYWKSKQDYIRIMENAGLRVDKIEEPKTERRGGLWKDEWIQSPYLIVRGQKV